MPATETRRCRVLLKHVLGVFGSSRTPHFCYNLPALKVSQTRPSPLSNAFRNHRVRCSEVPWLNEFGTAVAAAWCNQTSVIGESGSFGESGLSLIRRPNSNCGSCYQRPFRSTIIPTNPIAKTRIASPIRWTLGMGEAAAWSIS